MSSQDTLIGVTLIEPGTGNILPLCFHADSFYVEDGMLYLVDFNEDDESETVLNIFQEWFEVYVADPQTGLPVNICRGPHVVEEHITPGNTSVN